jgi:hypothetical protein
MTWHPEVLGIKQKNVLKTIGPFLTGREFYLAGGTAVALHLGHRHSVDFDWFTEKAIADPLRLAKELDDNQMPISKTGIDRGTLHGFMTGVRVSFIEYHYPLLVEPFLLAEYGCLLASLDDLSCMKLSAIAQRGSKKDFVDIYFLGMMHRPVAEMLALYRQKFGVQDVTSVLYGLVYFDDADRERMPRMFSDIHWETVKTTIRHWVKGAAE